MSTEDSYFAKKVLDRVKAAYNMSTDAELAEFFEVVPSTITGWKRRNTLDFKLLFKKCTDLSADWIIYEDPPMFRDPYDPRNITSPPEKRPVIADPGKAYDPNDLKQQATRFVKMIENLPWPVETRREILQSYLRIVDEQLRSLQEPEEDGPD